MKAPKRSQASHTERIQKLIEDADTTGIEKLVKDAVAVIKPKPDRLDECKAACEEAIEHGVYGLAADMDEYELFREPTTKDEKVAARDLGQIWKNLRDATLDPKLHWRLKKSQPTDEYVLSRIDECEKAANIPSPKPRRSPDYHKCFAAEEAYKLLTEYNDYAWKNYCALAAIIYGDPDTDPDAKPKLEHQCREVIKQARNRG